MAMDQKTQPISSAEMKQAARFALKCYGWELNLAASLEVVRLARGWPAAFSNNTTLYMRRIVKQIAYGYREVMDY